MSQCYRVQLKSSVSRTVKSEDTIVYPIDLTSILPEEEMKDLLRAVLEKHGWEAIEDAPGKFRKEGPQGEEMVLDVETLEVEVLVSEESEVTTEVEVEGLGESQELAQADAQAGLRRREAAAGDQIAERAEQELAESVRDRLTEGEEERTRDLNELLQEVYAESLKRKAGQLGDILEVSESTEDGDYELVIRVAQ